MYEGMSRGWAVALLCAVFFLLGTKVSYLFGLVSMVLRHCGGM